MSGSSVRIQAGPNPNLCLLRAVSQIDPTGLLERLDIYRRPAELAQVFKGEIRGLFHLFIRVAIANVITFAMGFVIRLWLLM